MIQPSRRGFITGLIAFAAAPAIVRASSLMPVKAMLPDLAWLEEDFVFRTSIPAGEWRQINQGAPYGRSPAMDYLPGAKELRGHLERFLRRAPPIVEFDKIDLTDPLWAMPKS
jgi:hypothetical protein